MRTCQVKWLSYLEAVEVQRLFRRRRISSKISLWIVLEAMNLSAEAIIKSSKLEMNCLSLEPPQ